MYFQSDHIQFENIGFKRMFIRYKNHRFAKYLLDDKFLNNILQLYRTNFINLNEVSQKAMKNFILNVSFLNEYVLDLSFLKTFRNLNSQLKLESSLNKMEIIGSDNIQMLEPQTYLNFISKYFGLFSLFQELKYTNLKNSSSKLAIFLVYYNQFKRFLEILTKQNGFGNME